MKYMLEPCTDVKGQDACTQTQLRTSLVAYRDIPQREQTCQPINNTQHVAGSSTQYSGTQELGSPLGMVKSDTASQYMGTQLAHVPANVCTWSWDGGLQKVYTLAWAPGFRTEV